MLLTLAIKSLLNRKTSVSLIVMAMTVSIFVLLSVEHIRHNAQESFSKTVSGVDLIIGAKTSSLNLLLYSVFRIGSPTNNISWQAYKHIEAHPNVNWLIPLSLGDSHKGYRVLGTTTNYFQYFNHGQQRALQFKQGKPFSDTHDVVLGANVAQQLNYQLGDRIVISHGIATNSFTHHDQHPFKVVGILASTGTPVDQTVHTSLQGLEAMHMHPLDKHALHQLEPKSITAIMLGLTPKTATFKVKREIDNHLQEPLMAILPGATLAEFWQMMSLLETMLRLISILVLVATLLGFSAMLLASIHQRTSETKLLRIIGASPKQIFFLHQLEVFFITVFSIILGVLLLSFALWLAKDNIIASTGLDIGHHIFSTHSLLVLLAILLASLLVSSIASIHIFNINRFKI